jgi:uncharacterized protein YjdB
MYPTIKGVFMKKFGKLVGIILIVAAIVCSMASCELFDDEKPTSTEVTGVSLNKSTLTLNAGGSETLTVTVSPSTAVNKSVYWISDTPNKVSVSQSGVVTGLSAGSATITVTSVDGGKTATCTVTVSPSSGITKVTLNKQSTSLLVGGTETLYAEVTPEEASNKTVTWSSSAPAIASVNSSGVVTAVAAGSATITVTSAADQSKTATCAVTVSATAVDVTSVAVNKSTLTLNVGGSETLTATISPTSATNQNVTWSSNNTSVATVTSNGKVTAVSAGSATITVTSDANQSKTATCTVTVSASTQTQTITVDIIGTPEVGGDVLVADVQKNFAGTVAYQWLAGGVEIPGENYYEYTPDIETAGKSVKVKVSCAGKTAESPAKSVPTVTYTVKLAGYGNMLFGGLEIVNSKGESRGFSIPYGNGFTSQWYADSVAIPGTQNSEMYAISGADAGKTITIKVTGLGQTVTSGTFSVDPAQGLHIDWTNGTSLSDADLMPIIQEVQEAYDSNLNGCKDAIDSYAEPWCIEFYDNQRGAEIFKNMLIIYFSLEKYGTFSTTTKSVRLNEIGQELKDLASLAGSGNGGGGGSGSGGSGG